VLEWRAGSSTIDCSERTLIMGILNVTPDSFSDGGRFLDPGIAVAEGIRMAEGGADILDVGGESTRPGAMFVPADEELGRVVPVIEGLAVELPETPISVDTRKASVALASLHAGASIVNDVMAGRDPEMFGVVASSGAGMVLMHMRGDPQTMQTLTDYDDVVDDVKEWLRGQLERAVAAGIERDRLAVDPGLGFAKTPQQNLLLLRDINRFAELGRPVVAGPSRKSFVGKATGTGPGDRLEGTAAAVAWLAARATHVIRVHDVKQMVRVVRMVDAIRRGAFDAAAAQAPVAQ
jgi:dihydropteroate synthase